MLYNEYTNAWQSFVDRLQDTGRFLAGIIDGALKATGDLVFGLIELADGVLTYAVGGPVVLFCGIFGIKPPNRASSHVSSVHSTIGAILNDPQMIVDSLVLGAVDAVEEEGLGYAIGYVGFNVAFTVITAGKSKAGNVRKLLRKGASWDDIVRARVRFKDLIRYTSVDDLIARGATVEGLIDIGATLQDLSDYLRRASVINPGSKTATLGRFRGIDNPLSYHNRAGNTSHFNMGSDWNTVKDAFNLSYTEMFDLFNRPFLDDMISRGQTIRFSHNPIGVWDGGLYLEWKYIQSVLGVTDANLVFQGGFWYVVK